MMESEKKIRDRVRSTVVEYRLASRDNIWKTQRKALHDVVDIGRTVSREELIILANKLKTKSSVQAEDLTLMKIAFVQSADNIITFLKVKGALHGLVRELSSTKPNYESIAAESICNLALGDAKSCLIVAKAAGPYLITNLSSFNSNLKATSVWALGNLVGSGERTWKILHSQGFLGKLLQLISDNDSQPDFSQELQHNSLTALSHLLRVGAKHLKLEEIHSVLQTVVILKNTSFKGLTETFFLLSCMDVAEKVLIENKVFLKYLNFMSSAEITVETVTEYTLCIRIIANLIAEPCGICALEVIQNWNCIQESIRKIYISTYSHLVPELGWLLGNLINHTSPQVQIEVVKFGDNFSAFESKCNVIVNKV